MAKPVRTITQKIRDIGEAAWESGDSHSDELGDLAERRIKRLTTQVEKLAAEVIKHRFALSDDHLTLLLESVEGDEVLAEALVGAWGKVEKIVEDAQIRWAKAERAAGWSTFEPNFRDCCVDGTCESDDEDLLTVSDSGDRIDLADPITGVRVQLTIKGDMPERFFQKCCEALKPFHKGNCRQA